MQKYYLAVDIGASGGRHVLGWIEEGSFHIQQVYRFDNGMVNRNGHLCWDLTNIFHEIKNGLIKCREIGKIPFSMGIDTWGVDFVLLDTHNQILGDTIAYRDARTGGMDLLVNEIITPEALYDKTGIQKQIFNTIFQLTAIKNKNPEIMDKAQDLLMLPDYFNFLLTGNKYIEYTNATTTQLVDVRTKGWDYGLIDSLGFKKEIFKGLSAPGTSVGGFCDTIKDEIGFSCEVVLPACHDTGSAVLAVPAKEEDFLYISSGTWSLMGIESKQPYITKYNMEHNFTNEGGYEYRYRVLKNIMGLWMVQNVRKELKHTYSYDELCDMARKADSFPSRLNVNDACFFAPENMTEEIRSYCRRTGQTEPQTTGEIAACIYHSLAESYVATVKEIEHMTGKCYSRLYIVGGGSNAGYLNELTAKETGKEIVIGPTEATAIGNLAVQMIKDGVFANLENARECIGQSFDIRCIK